MRRFTGPLPFSIEPHRRKQERKDLNPVERLWKPPALPGAHSCKGVRGESNPPPRPSQGRMPNHYTTDTINSNTPTRIRTRNASFEARHDRPFHHRGFERKARESNPHLRWENRLSRAARPTVSGYLPKVDPPGIEPGSPVCRTGVVPLDHEPV